MVSAQIDPIQRFIHRIAGIRGAGDDPDRQLLERFVGNADEGAFQTLFQRHGPLVLSVCTRVLGSVHDAEDAFQATFLVLVRKAGSIRDAESLGPCLYGVAYRTALKAKAQVLKRLGHEQPLVDVAAPTTGDCVAWRDLRAVLDDEVHRLPAKYRVPFVLCYLQGKTTAQAAQMLGCAQGTIFSRLAWARERLRKQLGQRRHALAAEAFGSILARSTVSAVVPVSHALSTSKAALAFAAGTAAAAGTSSAPAVALAEGVLRAMFLTKLKIAIMVLLAIAMAGTAGGVLARRVFAGAEGNVQIAGITQPAGPVAGEPRTDKDKLRGTWIPVAVTEAGKEIPEEEVQAKNFEMVITADKLNLPIRDDSKQVAYKLDPSKKPKQIDLLVEEGKTAKGIYSLEGTTLKLCVDKGDGERPTEFTAPKDSNQILIVLKKKH